MPIKRVWAPQIDFSVLRRELGLPGEFPAEVEAEAAVAAESGLPAGVDRTDIAFVTLDPAGSRDLDQAMHLARRDGGGYRIFYAIADVASFVRPGGAVAAESWRRGQTIYLPDGRVPLHPPVLSEGAVSLFPDVERAAVLWTIDLDAEGETVAVSVERARVRSRAKLSYEAVQEDSSPVALLPEIGGLLAKRAADRGAVNLPLPEQEVERAGEGDGAGWRLVLRAPLPIEEHNAQISLLTGMAAASIMLKGRIGLLRTMPAARADAVQKLRVAAASLGVPWVDGASVGSVVASVDPGTPRGAAFLDQAAELLRGAAYTPFDGVEPPLTTHAGVGAPYAHVTAPLRRLADRFATEICLALHEGRPVPDWAREALPALPKTMSDTDRLAGAATRGAVDLSEAVLLESRVGEVFEAAVLDVDERGGKSGTIAVDSPAVRAKCTGELPLGERIRVRLTQADPGSRKVLFEKA